MSRRIAIHCTLYILFVGVKGFEPSTPWSQTRCANRTALHPGQSIPAAKVVKNSDIRSRVHNFSQLLAFQRHGTDARKAPRIPAGRDGGRLLRHHPALHASAVRCWHERRLHTAAALPAGHPRPGGNAQGARAQLPRRPARPAVARGRWRDDVAVVDHAVRLLPLHAGRNSLYAAVRLSHNGGGNHGRALPRENRSEHGRVPGGGLRRHSPSLPRPVGRPAASIGARRPAGDTLSPHLRHI